MGSPGGLGASAGPGDRTSVPGLHAARCGQRTQASPGQVLLRRAWPALRPAHCALFQVEAVGIAQPAKKVALGEVRPAGAGGARDWGPPGKRVPTRCPGRAHPGRGAGPWEPGPAAGGLAEPARACPAPRHACRPHSPAPLPGDERVRPAAVVVESGPVSPPRGRGRGGGGSAEEEDGEPCVSALAGWAPTVCRGRGLCAGVVGQPCGCCGRS